MSWHHFKSRWLGIILTLALLASCQGQLGQDGADDQLHPDDTGFGDDVSVGPDNGLEDTGEVEPECETDQTYFARKAWPTVAEPVCLGCHRPGGQAPEAGAAFELLDQSALDTGQMSLDEWYAANLERFSNFVEPETDAKPYFLAKALGGAEHGGGMVVEEGSAQHLALAELAERLAEPGDAQCVEELPEDPLAFIELYSPRETYRRAAVLFGARLPTPAEEASFEGLDEEAALAELDRLVDGLMQEAAFSDWLKYAWNDIFLFRGIYTEFGRITYEVANTNDFFARRWAAMGGADSTSMPRCTDYWARFGFESEEQCLNTSFSLYLMSQRIGFGFIEEPLELIAHVVNEDLPFTKILTSDLVMMNYYTSLAYYGSARPEDNPFVRDHLDEISSETVVYPSDMGVETAQVPDMHEFRPMASVRRTGEQVEPEGHSTIFYRQPEQFPRAGILTSQAYLSRFPSTATNVNRKRARFFYDQFLGVDILGLADRRGDPAQASLESEAPTIDNPNCNVCHKVMDPVAGLFQDFYHRKEWSTERQWPPEQPPMIGAGSSGITGGSSIDYDPQQHGPPIQWLGELTSQDERFARTMVSHVRFQLTGHRPMPVPNPTQAGYDGAIVAYDFERQLLGEMARGFEENNYNMRWLIKEMVKSPLFRAADVRTPDDTQSLGDPNVRELVRPFGSGQLVTPEMLYRKMVAVIGRPWPRQEFERYQNRDDVNAFVIDDRKNDFLLRFNSDRGFRYVDSSFRDTYGGADFWNVTTRQRRPNSVMSAVSKRVANEFGCLIAPQEFSVPAGDRVLLAAVEPGQTTESHSDEIYQALEDVHRRMLMRDDVLQSELDRAFALFETVQQDGQARVEAGEVRDTLEMHCRVNEQALGQQGEFSQVIDDQDFTIRAWMAVLSYMALHRDFLFD